MAQWLESPGIQIRRTRCHGFDPLVWQGEKQLFLSLRVNSWADLFVPDLTPLRQCVAHVPKFVRTLKTPYKSAVRVSQPVVWKHENTAYRRGRGGGGGGGGGGSWVAQYYGCSLSPVKAARISRALY